jgi:pimeloyl-ACP methyl ester carboxylesterase
VDAGQELTVRTDDGAELAVTVRGSGGTTVVLSHGWAGGRRVWDAVSEHLLAVGHTVVTYDQRGHGGSKLGATPIGITRCGSDLGAVLDRIDARDAVIAGHSGGGFSAMAYAVAEPNQANVRLRGLVLLGTAVHDQDTSDGEVRTMGSPVFSWALSRAPLGRLMLRKTMGVHPDPDALELHRQLFAATPAKVRADYFRCSRGMDLRPGLADIAVPAVVLHGANDTVIAPELGEAVAAALPHARFERLADIGHMVPIEAPSRVADAVLELAGR